MSGIYGIYRYDNAPVDPVWMERMKEAMAYYGRDGSASMIEGPIGMGHLRLDINPEDPFDRQPERSERGLLVCTARLDNRDSLVDTFKISATEASQVSDGHLVSLAFDRWGEEICTHLQGDWSLAGWDRHTRRFLLARDAFGSGVLYHYHGKGFIAFASSLKALLALPGVVKEADKLRLAQVLVSWQHDAELTAYKGFRRLLRARVMTIDSGGETRLSQHWSPEGRPLLRYQRDEEYVQHFLELYTRAVQSCLRSQKPVAAQLSGGRDSGSVVALAAPLLANQGRELTAYTSVPCLPPDGAGDWQVGNEWELAQATATMAGQNVKHLPIDAVEYRVIQGIEHYLDLHDGPSHAASNHFWLQAILEVASRSGIGAVLGGQMGNATVSWSGNGFALLALMQGRPATAWRLLLHAAPNAWLSVKWQILDPFLLRWPRTVRRMMTAPRRSWQAYSALNLQMARELDIDGRMRAARYDPSFKSSFVRDSRLFFFEPEWTLVGDIAAESGARHSLAYLDPTTNLTLTEFLLRVPDDLFYRRGQSSFLMKQAFSSRLPEPVLKSQRKGLQAADLGRRILRELAEFRDCLDSLDALPEAQAMLDLPLMRRCLENVVAKVDYETTARSGMILARGLGVGLFLRRLADSHC
jgi:asparagine synthase (glutamine-hydrolysing)